MLYILKRKFANWIEHSDLEIELRKILYRKVGQVSPKTASFEELENALDNFNPLILNILDSGVPLYDDGTYDRLKEHYKQIVPSKVVMHDDYWEVVA